jgi:hypothetical protein
VSSTGSSRPAPSTPDHLVELALGEAADGFDEAVERLIAAAAGDAAAITSAANQLASRTQSADSAEHVAFTYLAAAFRQMSDQALGRTGAS